MTGLLQRPRLNFKSDVVVKLHLRVTMRTLQIRWMMNNSRSSFWACRVGTIRSANRYSLMFIVRSEQQRTVDDAIDDRVRDLASRWWLGVTQDEYYGTSLGSKDTASVRKVQGWFNVSKATMGYWRKLLRWTMLLRLHFPLSWTAATSL